jgi:hypothetical protein
VFGHLAGKIYTVYFEMNFVGWKTRKVKGVWEFELQPPTPPRP